MFLQDFGDDSTPEDIVMDISSLRIKGKEIVKYFNQRFSCLKNRIHVTVLLAKELLIAYYIKGLPTTIDMWVKRAHKTNLQQAFAEAVIL